MREWTHRKLLARYLGTIAATSAALALLAFVLVPLTSRQFAIYVVSCGALVACFGMSQGYGRTCAKTPLAASSRPGRELKLLPLLAAVPAVWLFVRIARAHPHASFETLALAVAATAFFLAVLFGCRAIARAGSAAQSA